MKANGQYKDNKGLKITDKKSVSEDFVLDKSIFSNIFEKDIKRVYMYKKCERLAKAIHLIGPAFAHSPALRDRLDKVAVGLVDAAIESPAGARSKLSRELLALSSVLAIARTGGLLSAMNADLIAHEAQNLLQEVASYEEPRLFLPPTPSLAELARDIAADRGHHVSPFVDEEMAAHIDLQSPVKKTPQHSVSNMSNRNYKGHIESQRQNNKQSNQKKTERQEAILSILKNKGTLYIKDISTVIRDVSEKTIQRELLDLVETGRVLKEGERRWTQYSLIP